MSSHRHVPKIEGVCVGKPREGGIALGASLSEKINAVGASLYSYDSFRVKQPWWMPYSLYRFLAEYQARTTLEQPFRRHFPSQTERLDGMAEGAEVSLESLYLYHAFEALMTSLDSVTCQVPLAACTAVAARGRRTSFGTPLYRTQFRQRTAVRAVFHVARSGSGRWIPLASIHVRTAQRHGGWDQRGRWMGSTRRGYALPTIMP